MVRDDHVFAFFVGVSYAAGLCVVPPVLAWALDVSPLWAAGAALCGWAAARLVLLGGASKFRRAFTNHG